MIAAVQRLACPLLLGLVLLSSLAACETPHGSAVGGTSGDSGGGRISLGWPF
jgi:hypothetical protein